jgi:protein-export membrane protein SecD
VGSNWWFKFVLTLALILLAIRSLIPTFFFPKPENLPVFRVQYELGADNKPLLDKDGKPQIKYEKIKSGKNKGKVLTDENTQPVPIFARDNNDRCIPEWTYASAYLIDLKNCKDKNAPNNCELAKDEKTGKPKVRTYPERRSIYDRKEDERVIDARREYVMVDKRDIRGQPMTTTETVTEQVPAVDKDGKPILEPKLGANGVAELDKDGKPVMIPKMEAKKTEKQVPVKEIAQMTDVVWERCYLPWWFRTFFSYKSRLNLGLDLQGGTHLVMEVDVKKALSNRASSLARDLTTHFETQNLIPPSPSKGQSSRYVFHPAGEPHIRLEIPGVKEIDALPNQEERAKAKEWLVNQLVNYLLKQDQDWFKQQLTTLKASPEEKQLSDLLKELLDPKKTPTQKQIASLLQHTENAKEKTPLAAFRESLESRWHNKQIANFNTFMATFREGILEVKREDKAHIFKAKYNEETIKNAREAAITQAIETIRGRVDSLGVSEPSISKYGDTQIVIQLPGLKNPQRAKELIGKTALLAFHVVEDDHDDASNIYDDMSKDTPTGITPAVSGYNRPHEAKTAQGRDRFFHSEERPALQTWIEKWNTKLAEGYTKGTYARPYILMLGSYETGTKSDKKDLPSRTYLLWREPSLTGEALDEARPQIDPQNNRPEVSLNFNLQGADLFEKMTGEHIGHRFAIVLEEKVDSAPVIQTRIGGGRARITLGGYKSYEETLQDAKDLAFVLKSGSLPAPVDILYEKTIGPALGQDSIRRGVLSLAIGFALVLFFMIVYYRASGFNAVLALFLNMLFVMAIMASFGATLTLPGMAGVLLTIGMAVDANILIFERIREELASGKAVRVSVQNGYDKALSTIIDANITTAIAGIVLYQYGSGPIRGFAVTLLIGIICSVFTALFVTRLVFEMFVQRRQVRSLSI